ncbi:M61 family metallopeptidase [uncultured Piscinibacter sp.]|uniref:M61 family metallopeptidase n=1 Tax=uncultured Piscinibacter sp. TaxID=1131835 RepID=UPI00262C45CF|nr:PDZ domain-containing protein [uncultured Piscinibacter sp.]
MITYRIDVEDVHAHLFRVTLRVPRPAAQQRLSLPVWIPGSYLVREFARHLSGLHAEQGGQPVPLAQLDKASWVASCAGRAELVVSARVYAFDTSVRAAFLDARRGFFNGTGICLRAEGREDEPHRLQIGTLPHGWQVATAMRALKVDATGRGLYEAADYDELVDHPVELGTFWRGRFEAHGVPHEFVVAGALPDFDGERLLADTRRICEAQIGFWHGSGKRAKAPFERYVFLLNTAEDGHGGLEHRGSTALLSARRNLPQRGRGETSDAYVELLGLISHEYFHTWNVKRLRPAEFARYDYTRENYTQLLWFFEGFTSYYDDLLLRRAGLIDTPRYLKLLSRTIAGVAATPGRQVQSVAQSSFDAWVKYYRSDENTPNATISYYAKGSLVALALDLTLRRDGSSLDEVMRSLWVRAGGGPIAEADIASALERCAGRSYARELADWVHGTAELPLQGLLYGAGIEWKAQPATIAQRLGLRISESALTGVKATHVLRGGAAEAAGIAAGDEILAVSGWRLRRLDEAQRVLTPGRPAELLVVRDQRVLTLKLVLPVDAGVGAPVQLAAEAKPGKSAQALREAWLGR